MLIHYLKKYMICYLKYEKITILEFLINTGYKINNNNMYIINKYNNNII